MELSVFLGKLTLQDVGEIFYELTKVHLDVFDYDVTFDAMSLTISSTELALYGAGRRICEALAVIDDTIQPVDAATAHTWKLPWTSGRTGSLAVTCGPHREFVYGDQGAASEAVRSASHGYLPTSPRMSGFFRMFGPNTDGIPQPSRLTDAAAVVRQLWSKRQGRRR